MDAVCIKDLKKELKKQDKELRKNTIDNKHVFFFKVFVTKKKKTEKIDGMTWF